MQVSLEQAFSLPLAKTPCPLKHSPTHNGQPSCQCCRQAASNYSLSLTLPPLLSLVLGLISYNSLVFWQFLQLFIEFTLIQNKNVIYVLHTQCYRTIHQAAAQHFLFETETWKNQFSIHMDFQSLKFLAKINKINKFNTKTAVGTV